MQLFKFFKIQQLNKFLKDLSVLNESYKKKSFSFEKEYFEFADDVIKYFKQVGDALNQSETEKLRNFFQTAVEGVDPIKLEPVKTHRRAMTRIAAFHCLSRLTELLQEAIQKDQAIIDRSEEAIGQLVLSLIQAKAITEAELSENLNQDQLEIIWYRLTQNEQVKLHERKLRLSITQEDIFLLFIEVMEKIKDH